MSRLFTKDLSPLSSKRIMRRRRRYRAFASPLIISLVAIAAVLAWLTAQMLSVRTQRAIAERLQARGVSVTYDSSYDMYAIYRKFSVRVPTGAPWHSPDWVGGRLLADAIGVRVSGDLDDDTLPDICRLSALESLDLSNSAVADNDLRKLKGLKHLKTLCLSNTEITGSGLAEFGRRFPSLARLRLDMTQLDDAGLRHMATIAGLQKLDVSMTHVSDAGLVHLAKLRELRELRLEGTSVTDAGLHHLKGLTQLRSLGLSGEGITDAGMQHIRALRCLEVLTLRSTKVTDQGLQQLQGLKALRYLFLGDTRIGDDGMRVLQSLVNLEYLKLNDTRLTDVGLESLKHLRHLECLDIKNTDVSDGGLKQLVGLRNLRAIHVRGTAVTDSGIADLRRALPTLEVIR